MPLGTAVNAQETFRHALSIFPDYSAEIEDYGSDSTGRFSEQLFTTRIAVNRGACDAYLDLYDVDPTPFLVLFHGACDPLNRATIAALAVSLDTNGEDENDQHVAGCCPVFWEDAAPMQQCLEASGRADVPEIRLLAVMLSGMYLISRTQDGASANIAVCFDDDGKMVSMDHLQEMERLAFLAEDGEDDAGHDPDQPDDYEELHFD